MGKALDGIHEDNLKSNVDNAAHFEELCAYLKLYHARTRCVLMFTNSRDERLDVQNSGKAIENLNPFLKYRMLIITPEKMISGNELFMKLIQ